MADNDGVAGCWECPQCTFVNQQSAARCDICLARAPRLKSSARKRNHVEAVQASISNEEAAEDERGDQAAVAATTSKLYIGPTDRIRGYGKKKPRADSSCANSTSAECTSSTSDRAAFATTAQSSAKDAKNYEWHVDPVSKQLIGYNGRTRKVVKDQWISAEEALERAKAEGLTFVPSAGLTSSGFRNVMYYPKDKPLPYSAKVTEKSHQMGLGSFATAEGAALAVARWYGPKRSAEVYEQELAKAKTMDAAEALRLADEEGLTLLTSDTCATGYVGVGEITGANLVHREKTPFHAKFVFPALSTKVSFPFVGRYATKEEAALNIARKLGPKLSAECAHALTIKHEKKEKKDEVLANAMSVEEVWAAAKAEGLRLIPTRSDHGLYNSSGYRYVQSRPGPIGANGERPMYYTVLIDKGNIKLGPYATAEEASSPATGFACWMLDL